MDSNSCMNNEASRRSVKRITYCARQLQTMQLWQWSLVFFCGSNVDGACWRAVDCNPYLACSQGIGTIGPNCSKDGMPNCSRCFEGYHLRNQKCEMKHCHLDGFFVWFLDCLWLFSFNPSRIFWCLHSPQLFVSLRCNSWTPGTCGNGTAATGPDCPAPSLEQCSSCNPGNGLSSQVI